MSDTILNRMIDNEVRKAGYDPKKCLIEPVVIDVESASQEEYLHNNLYVLVTDELTFATITTRILLEGSDNVFAASQTDFNEMDYNRYQFFKDYLKIVTSNYGASFTSYQLHFLKITPTFD